MAACCERTMVEGGSSVRSMGVGSEERSFKVGHYEKDTSLALEMISPTKFVGGLNNNQGNFTGECNEAPDNSARCLYRGAVRSGFCCPLSHATEKMLSDAEVQEFWLVYQEMQRRRGTIA